MKNIAHFFTVFTFLIFGVFGVVATSSATEVETPEIDTVNVILTKIECANEANLPNLALMSTEVDSETVIEFLTVHPNCHRVSGWKFQYDTTGATNPGDNIIGEAGDPWMTTMSTDANGEVSFNVPIDGVAEIRVREVMQPGYIGFTYGDANDNSIGYTAELYCGSDVTNFDNYDAISAPVAGETYHCVAWNAPIRTYPAFCGNGIIDQSWEACDGSDGCTQQCQTAAPLCTENIFARLVVTNTENFGYGDVTDVVYVGGTAQPDFAWFPVKLGGVTVTDLSIDTFSNVAGLAVERSLEGIRVRLHGGHDDGSREHSEGYIEFSNGTTISSQAGELGSNAPENPQDSIMEVAPQQDEIWVSGSQSHYWFTVTTENDGFVTAYQGPMCESEEDSDLCSNIEGIQAIVPEGMVVLDSICTTASGNGGNGGGVGGAYAPACADGSDNDNDGKADYPADPGCSSSSDGDESEDGVQPVSGGGNGLGTSTGEVLGAATGEPVLPPSCQAYINEYMKFGRKNNPEEVKKLQQFLNDTLGLNIPVTGYFGTITRDAVKNFQKSQHKEILQPWLDAGWKGKDLENGTGYVFKTTKRWINLMKCQSLEIPLPDLR